jgi:hypothetical protein
MAHLTSASGRTTPAMPSYQFPVEAAQIALFVRAAGGADVDVFDPERPAPPTFVQSSAQFDPEWPFRPRPGRPWLGSGRESTGDPAAGHGSILHAEQHFEYFRPVRAGMVLTATTEPGETWVYGVRFKKQVWPGDQLTVTAEVVEVGADGSGRQLAELTVTTRNGAGEEVLTGYATARVDQIQGGRSTAARA